MRFIVALSVLVCFFTVSFARPEGFVTAKGNLDRGIRLFGENKFDSAIVYLHRAVKPGAGLLGARGDTLMRLAYTYITLSYEELGQNDSAAVYGHKTISVARAMKDTLATAYAWYSTATAYNRLGKTDYAVECYESAYKLGEKFGDYPVVFSTYLALAGIYSRQGDHAKALRFLERARDLAKAEKKQADYALALTMMGAIHARSENYDPAIESFRESMDIHKQTGNERLYHAVQSSLVAALSKSGRHDEALAGILSPGWQLDSAALHETFARVGSVKDLKMQKLMSDIEAKDAQSKFDILQRDYFERQARNLRLRIWLISGLAVSAIALLLLLYNRQRQKAKAEAAARYAQQKENELLSFQRQAEALMMRKYLDGLESERGRISKELHDGICNDLLAVEMQMKNGDGDLSGQAALLQTARENIRNVSHELMPPAFQDASIDEILSDYLARLRTPDGVNITCTQDGGDWSALPQKTALEIYRVAQEAVANSLKHAGADRIGVTLSMDGTAATLEIRDNGVGFDKAARRGAGLRTIRERVESIGGTLDIAALPDGTTIAARFKI